MEEEEGELFESAIKGNWDKVAEAYEKNSTLQQAKLTKTQDTALHLAVSDGQTQVVLKLVQIIGPNASKILHIKNEKGNTPLHLAAAIGDVQMCHCLAKHDPDLIKARNSDRETPLFMAALHGKKQAFLCLHFLHSKQQADYVLCRKRNGDTILHCTIHAEHFDLACHIIHYYPNLVTYVNETGQSALHVLACKSNAFKSGSRLRPFDRLIYHYMIVNKLQEEIFNSQEYRDNSIDETRPKYPDNYTTCLNFFHVIQSSFQVITSQIKKKSTTEDVNDEENTQQESSLSIGTNRPKKEKPFFPPTYATFLQFIRFMIDATLIVLGFGISNIKKIREKKERHMWAAQLLNQLVGRASWHRYKYNGQDPRLAEPSSILQSQTTNTNIEPENRYRDQKAKNDQHGLVQNGKNTAKFKRRERPILIAARKGVTEIVEKILDVFPVAVQDLDADNKNVVLLSVEHRQTDVYQLLLKKTILKQSVFRQVDKEGNSAWHLAAKFGEHRPWLIPGAALQMQWEIKWYQFVKSTMPPNFFVKHNNNGKTPKDIFTESHKALVKEGSAWLTKTSESCSLVATLVATVAFTTSATVPGGLNQETGQPILGNETPFKVSAIASLVALCSSVTALVIFLTVITSRFQERDFAMNLPRKLFLGLILLFTSIASMLVSFCAGHVFVLNVRYVTYPLYAATCLPVTIFVLAQLSLYFDLAQAIFKNEPQRRYKHKVSYSRHI
ncbi:Ankyrin repeat family protein [Euphorbia peplus]|nr:Ankyrin repeat family protein [Euphorbia peplus]